MARSWVLLFALLGALAISAPARGQAPAARAGKVGYVDIGMALNDVEEGKAAIAKLKAEVERKQQEVIKRRDKLQEKKDGLDKQGTMLKPETRAERQRELDRERDGLEEMIAQVQRDLVASQHQLTEDIGGKLRRVVEQIGDREGYSEIFSTEGLLYYKRHLDITREVVRAYNKQYGGK